MMIGAIPSERMPEDVLTREIDMLTVSGMNFQYGKELGKDVSVMGLKDDYDAIFLAPGLWASRSLEIPGMQQAKVSDGLSFLNAVRTEGKVKVGNRVLVIGGGSVASDVALVAQAAGAQETTVVCLESEREMPCLLSERNEMIKRGIRIENSWGPREVLSKTKMVFMSCTAVFGAQGEFAPTFDEAKTREFEFDEVIIAVGQTMETTLATGLKQAFGKDGFLEVNEETNEVMGHPGIFAGGDIIRGAGTVVEAVGDGRRAAKAIDRTVIRR
jgi:NADPH-dependent glutamate synthase beta subunit-like oxidoreductase